MDKQKEEIIEKVRNELNKLGIGESNIYVDKNGSYDFIIVSEINAKKEEKIFKFQLDLNRELSKLKVEFEIYPSDSLVAQILKNFRPL